jgi:hypothetical protein
MLRRNHFGSPPFGLKQVEAVKDVIQDQQRPNDEGHDLPDVGGPGNGSGDQELPFQDAVSATGVVNTMPRYGVAEDPIAR